MMKLLSLLMLFLFMPSAFAQKEAYQYQLKGSYKLESSKTEPVKYTMRWNEKDGEIKGTYSDNYFARFAEVAGERKATGRTFIVTFPELKKGVKSITIVGSVEKEDDATTVPIGIVTRDLRGNPLTTTEAESSLNILNKPVVAQRQEDPECVGGFGMLAGYCGVYAGLIAEEVDRRNRCDLLIVDAVRLELTEEGSVLLHLGPVNELVQTPAHSVGRIPYNPLERSVDMIGRICGPLAGVNSSSTTCKRVHLIGDFYLEDNDRRFTGTYEITEEDTNLLCRYTLSMEKQL
ncbi:MAG: hypothetical protein ACLGHN_01910 [Bacteriovoracia bacterium]